ncbi:MAG: NACHT domain-containing protein [Planctomycetes bacterium]|nr:NACHT domain-containing protein [Planctomycetota bacterium]
MWTNPHHDRRLLLYAASLRDKFGFVRFVGLPTQGGPEDTSVEALFVEPALSSERIDPNRPEKEWPQRSSLIEAIIDNPRLVILGDPGSGKSTLVSWIVLNLLSRDRNRLKDAIGPLVPLALVLRDLEVSGEVTWQKLLARFIAHPTGQALGSPGEIEDFLYRGQAMVLVDGLDEAGDIATRQAIVTALHGAFTQYPSVRWLITSRVVGYHDAYADRIRRRALMEEYFDQAHILDPTNDLSDADVPPNEHRPGSTVASLLYVSPFDEARIAMFVRNWHEQHETNRADRSLRSSELIQALDRSPQVKGLARIPNLLTMIALVYRVYLRLPDGRALLHERIAQAYLETIETARKLPTPGHTLEDMKRWLGYAAFRMQRARFSQNAEDAKGHGILVSRDDLVEHIVFAMGKGNADAIRQLRPTAVAFVDWVARRAGIVIPRAENLFAFAHLSFQEYFAAWFIAEQITGPTWNKANRTPSPLAAGTDLLTLRAAIDDVRWHESIILLFELLAVRGEWSDEMMNLLFSPTEDAAWSMNTSYGRRLEILLQLACDIHSGLSNALRLACYRQAWRELSFKSMQMHREGRFTISGWFADTFLNGTREHWPAVFECLSRYGDESPLEAIVWADADDKFVAQLCNSGRGVAKCTSVFLGQDKITDAGAASLAARDSSFTALTSLYFFRTQITDAGVAALAARKSMLTKLTLLSLSSAKGVSDTAAAALAADDSGLKGLTTLDLNDTRIGDTGATALATYGSGLPALTTLYLSHTEIGDPGVAALVARNSALRALTTLDLGATQVGDMGAASLATSGAVQNNLNRLSLRNTKISDAGAAALAANGSGLKALTMLDLSGTQVGDAGVTAISANESGLPALRTLYLRDTKVGDAGIEALASKDSGLKNLTALDLSGTQIRDSGLVALAAKESGLGALTTLDLCDTKVGDAGAAALAAMGSRLSSLSKLSVRGTKITDVGAAMLERALPRLEIIR